MKLKRSFYMQLSKDKDGNIDVIKLVRLLVAKYYVDNPNGIVAPCNIYDLITTWFKDDELCKGLIHSMDNYVKRAEYKLKRIKNKLNYNYFVHIDNFNWMYSFVGNRQFYFKRGKGIQQRIKTKELVEFCCELTRRLVAAGGTKSMSRQYFLTMKDSLTFKLSYHKLSGLLAALDNLWLIHKSVHNIDEPAVYSFGGHNPFRQLVPSSKEIKVVPVHQEIIVKTESPIL
jgi:hypothetical protein